MGLLGHVDPSQKSLLAKQLLNRDSPNSPDLHMRMCTKLPLPEDPDRPRIDYVAFMLDMSSVESLSTLHHNLQHVELDFFHGRSCIVVCNGILLAPVQVLSHCQQVQQKAVSRFPGM